jgi:ribosomal protein S18 acetylase RimI-like enzyme
VDQDNRRDGSSNMAIIDAYAAGLDYLSAKVDSDNLSGALAIYERIGFKTYKTLVNMEKRIDS